jgi:Fe2+ or Zn2+ uptake regulation protein
LILEYKKILPSILSNISKINRTTIYSILKKLKEKNLISEDI